ncbi:MAG: sterol desaturase family protein [Actinomycetes bacterium]
MDLTTVALPGFVGSMVWERTWLRRHAATRGPGPADYERRDTTTSLTMGIASAVVPLIAARALAPVTPGRGRHHRVLVGVAVAAAVAATLADRRRRSVERAAASATDPGPTAPHTTAPDPPEPGVDLLARIGAAGAVGAVFAGGAAFTLWWNARTAPEALWSRRIADLGRGPLALAVAVAGWDFVYYWNHRWMHTSRSQWAYHVVHHSSEHYNLSTALRQPVAGALTAAVPYGLLSWLGVHPDLVEHARAINLLYQYWIHTDVVRRIGPGEQVLNTPSHHRVHHGSNPRYLDRNHGSILITWDRLFGTFTEERDDDPVVYGLTTNLGTFDPVRVATHEYVAIARDVAAARSWRERLAFVVRGPGWADRHRRQQPERAAA